jgi:hypothetical protein
MRSALGHVARALTGLFFSSLTACPGGDAPYTHHLDGGDGGGDGDVHDGGDPSDATHAGDDGTKDAPADTQPDGQTASGTGARCGVNGRNDCGPFMACDAVLGCVECASDDECPLAAKHCVAGACGECATGADAAAIGCPAGAPSCWPADHVCHPKCAGPASCPATAPMCDPASGECRGCDLDADCAPRVCSPITRQCVQCVRDADCGGGEPRCDVARAVCVACASDDDCGIAEPVCDPARRACRVGCTSDAQCPGERCDPATALCVAAAVDAGSDATDAARE